MLFAALMLQAATPLAFAPPLDAPIRVVTERDEGATAYRTERLIRFARDGEGYRADVIVLQGTAEASTQAASMFDAALATLIGRAMTFRLDGTGKVVAVDDREALWGAFCQGIAAIVMARRGHAKADLAAMAERLAAPLRAFPVERQLAVLGSFVSSLEPEEAERAPGGIRAVRVPGTSPFGGPITLEGTRTIETSGGLLHIVTHANADVSLPARPDAPARSGHVALEVSRDLDARTGLLRSGTETVHATIEGAPQPDRLTTVRVEPAPLSAWPK